MMDKAKMDPQMDGAYSGFKKPNLAAQTPLGVKTKALLGAKEKQEKGEQ